MTLPESNETEALRASLIAYVNKCNDKEKLGDILAIYIAGKTLADLPEKLRPMFEEVSVAGVVVLVVRGGL
jgi:hypothetical protein